jgi:hypothetical protein
VKVLPVQQISGVKPIMKKKPEEKLVPLLTRRIP